MHRTFRLLTRTTMMGKRIGVGNCLLGAALLGLCGAVALPVARGADDSVVIWGDSIAADMTAERLAGGLRAVGAKNPDRRIVNAALGTSPIFWPPGSRNSAGRH
jgi:hypothetical protein